MTLNYQGRDRGKERKAPGKPPLHVLGEGRTLNLSICSYVLVISKFIGFASVDPFVLKQMTLKVLLRGSWHMKKRN
jgi:hypothetical protein